MFFAKIPRHASQNAITEGDFNTFWLVTAKVLNSYTVLLLYPISIFRFLRFYACFSHFPAPELCSEKEKIKGTGYFSQSHAEDHQTDSLDQTDPPHQNGIDIHHLTECHHPASQKDP